VELSRILQTSVGEIGSTWVEGLDGYSNRCTTAIRFVSLALSTFYTSSYASTGTSGHSWVWSRLGLVSVAQRRSPHWSRALLLANLSPATKV
jgi:hypothetical protein